MSLMPFGSLQTSQAETHRPVTCLQSPLVTLQSSWIAESLEGQSHAFDALFGLRNNLRLWRDCSVAVLTYQVVQTPLADRADQQEGAAHPKHDRQWEGPNLRHMQAEVKEAWVSDRLEGGAAGTCQVKQ